MKIILLATAMGCVALAGRLAEGATINWTNTASGGWNTATNWNPNQVPGATDTAIITNAGVTVTLDISPTVGGIILGTNGAGTVTLSLAGQTLTLNGPLTVNPSGSFTVDSGALTGNATISGTVKWTGGTFGLGNYAMTIATNGTVILAGLSGTNYTISAYVTNAGTLRLQGGDLNISYCGANGWGGLNNLSGALLDLAADGSISTPCGGPGFINGGTLRKSAGTGTNFILAAPFVSTGIVDAQTGTISLNGGSGSGLFVAETGATLAFSSATFTLTGNMTSSNAVLAGGTLSGNGTINGRLNWTSGTFGSGNNALTIATNALLVLAGTNGGNYILSEAVTNAGTVRMQSGNLQIAYCGGGLYGTFINLPGALVDMTADVSIGIDGCSPGFINAGTVRKSGGTGTNYITGTFITSGTVDAQTGTISLNGNDSGNGLFNAAAGATLAFSGGTFAFNGNLVSSNATLAGATLFGNGVISGVLNWTSGTFGSGNNTLTIASNAVLILAGTNGGTYALGESVTNAGIVRVQSGNLLINWCALYGTFNNLPGALVDMTADVSIGIDGCSPGFINAGTVRKSGGTGTNYITGTFITSGTVDAQTGTISLNGNDSGNGLFNAAAGATLAFSGGTFAFNGNLVSSNATLAGATLFGNGTISGVLNWTSGTFGSGNNTLTIASNAVLILAGTNGGTYALGESVTNAGIVRVQSGNLLINWCALYGTFINLPGALVDMTADVSIGSDGCSPGFYNKGTVRKSAGTGTNNITGVFVNTGTVDAQSGTISFNGTDSGGGVFAAETGATLAFSGGTITLAGNLISSNAVLAGATLSGNGTINGLLNWTSGKFGSGNSALTIASNSVLVLAGANGSNYLMEQAVTNAGTVRVQSGNLQINNCGGGQYGQFINLPGALVDLKADVSFSDDGCGLGIVNGGTVRKSGGTGTSSINGVFANTGTVDALIGKISFNGSDTGGGLFAAESGATLAFSSGTLTLNGNLTSANATLAGSTLLGNGSISGVLNWTGGMIGGGNYALTIASNALVVLAGVSGSNYLIMQAVTNAGTVRVQSGNLQIDYCGGGQYGQFINLPGALVDLVADVAIGDDGCGSGFVNAGTLRKSGGSGNSPINGVFLNTGTIDAQIGTISLPGAYTLANGTRLSFGLNGPASNGQISLSGAANFLGSLSANFNNPFFWPTVGSSFKLLNYTSASGVLFTNTTLPAFITWQTNYSPTNFTLTVIARSTNPAPTSLFFSQPTPANLFIEWYGDHTGWKLQSQTNPLTVGLYTNWATVPGSALTNMIYMPIDKTNGSVFFRLAYP